MTTGKSKTPTPASALARGWLTLAHARLPTACLRQILAWDDPLDLLRLPPSGLRQRELPASLGPALRAVDRDAVERALNWQGAGAERHIISWADADYPALLREIPHPPVILYGIGLRARLGDPQIAIVGSRRPDAYGCRLAASLARDLVHHGLTITSGLAAGIDGQAHSSALDANGQTIAVLGNGLASVYPPKHRRLAERIAERGLLLSEFPPDAAPLPAHFPQRNRIISGLSAGTLVIQATLRSGSLITVRHALEQGREVFAVPGAARNPLSQGCHRLIQQGAKLVTSAEEVIEELGTLCTSPSPHSPSRPKADDPNPEEGLLLRCMGFEPASIDELTERSGLTSEKISSMLLLLELQDKVASQEGGIYMRI